MVIYSPLAKPRSCWGELDINMEGWHLLRTRICIGIIESMLRVVDRIINICIEKGVMAWMGALVLREYHIQVSMDRSLCLKRGRFETCL